MPTRNVTLTDQLDSFVESTVASGRFSDASEVMREGLRLLAERDEERQAKLAWLRGEIQEGLDDMERGDFVTLRSPDELSGFMKQALSEASGEFAAERRRG